MRVGDFSSQLRLCNEAATATKAVRDEEKWPPLQPLKVSALVIIPWPYFSRSLAAVPQLRNKRPYIRLVSNWHSPESHHFLAKAHSTSSMYCKYDYYTWYGGRKVIFDRRLIGANLKQKRSPSELDPQWKALMKNNPAMETCRQFHVVSPPQWYLITLPYAATMQALSRMTSLATFNVWGYAIKELCLDCSQGTHIHDSPIMIAFLGQPKNAFTSALHD